MSGYESQAFPGEIHYDTTEPVMPGRDMPSDYDFMDWADCDATWACLMCGLVVADQSLHRDFHRWMNGTARSTNPKDES